MWFLCRDIVAILLPEIVRHAFATLATSPPLVMGIRLRVLEQRYDDNLSVKPQVSLVVNAVLNTCFAFELVTTVSLRATGVVLSLLFRVLDGPMASVPVGAQCLRQ